MSPEESFEYISFPADSQLILTVLNKEALLVCPSDVDLRRYATIAEAKDTCNSSLNTSAEIHMLIGTTLEKYIRYEDAILALSDIQNYDMKQAIKDKIKHAYVYLFFSLLVLGFALYHPMYVHYVQNSATSFTIFVFIIFVIMIFITYYGSFQ